MASAQLDQDQTRIRARETRHVLSLQRLYKTESSEGGILVQGPRAQEPVAPMNDHELCDGIMAEQTARIWDLNEACSEFDARIEELQEERNRLRQIVEHMAEERLLEIGRADFHFERSVRYKARIDAATAVLSQTGRSRSERIDSALRALKGVGEVR